MNRTLAGAVGLEPTPASLTVRCPTNWTTPQPHYNSKCCTSNFHPMIADTTDYSFGGGERRYTNRGKRGTRGVESWFPRGRPKEGSRPSPQSPKGILGFLPSDTATPALDLPNLTY